MNATNIQPYSKAIVQLIKGTVEKDDNVWTDLLNYQVEIQDYLSVIGLELIVKKEEGFAFVKQIKLDDDKTMNLVSRRQLGFEVSVVLIVLRHILEEFDTNPTETQSTDKYVSASDIKEELEMFLQEKNNKVRFMKDIDGYINKVVELGFLVKSRTSESEPRYRIHRIIKEKITLDDLVEFKHKLSKYDTDESL